MQGVIDYAHKYFSAEKCGTSSTYRELLGVLRCLRAMLHACAGKCGVPSGRAKPVGNR
jgi:hypothetical protein